MSRKGRRAKVKLAQAKAELQYGGQLSELGQILAGLKTDLHSNVHQARIGGRINARSARAAIPKLQKAFKPSLQGVSVADKLVNSQLAGLPADSPFRAAVAVSQGGEKGLLADALAQNTAELSKRAVDARIGAEQNVRSLRAQYHQDAGKTIDQIKSTLGQQGLYAATTFQDLIDTATANHIKIRGQNVTAANSRRSQRGQNKRFGQTENDKYILKYGHPKAEVLAASPGQRKHWANQVSSSGSKSGKKWATPTQAGAIQDAIESALRDAQKLKSHGFNRAQASDRLHTGDSTHKIAKARPLYATAALDLAYNGFISAATRKALRQRKFRPHHYGLPIKPPHRPKPKPTGGNVGGAIGGALGGGSY